MTVKGTSTDAQAPAAVFAPGVDQELDAAVEAPAATSPGPFVCLDSRSLDKSVAAWAQSALRFLETTTDERQRIAVRDEAVRVAALAAAVDAGVAVAIAYEVLQRAVRSIGKHTPRRRAGRRRSAASDEATPDPVGGDPTAASEGIESGQRPPHVGENRSPGGTISVDGPTPAAGDEAAPHPAGSDTPPTSAGTEGGQGLPPVDGNRSPGGTISVDGPTPAADDEAAPHPVGGDPPPPSVGTEGGQGLPPVDGNRSPGGTISADGPRSTTGDLPRATRSAYRQDAEAITDAGFERISASVRAAAAADSAAGHKLDRGLVRAAGAVEAAGGDPGDLQVVEAKKQELGGGRKRSAVDEAADDLPPCYVSPRIIEVARQVLGDRIDLDPASTAAQNRHARARVFYDGTDASWPGLKAAWPKDARVWVHVPRGADAVAFVQRVLTHAAAGAPVVVLTENTTHLPWAQSLLAAATAVCFIAGDATVQRPRTDDPRVVEVEEAPLAAPQGHLLVGLNVNRTAFEQRCAGLGVSLAQGTDQGNHAGILSTLRLLPFGRKTSMPAS